MIVEAVVGIDPGKAGGIAYINLKNNMVAAIPMPETERDILDELNILIGTANIVVYLERVGTIFAKGGKVSPKAMFSFGQGYGFLRGAIMGSQIRLENVQPQTWQKALGCLSKGDKNVTKQRAQELFPNMKITHATADALLIAEFGRRNTLLEYEFGVIDLESEQSD